MKTFGRKKQRHSQQVEITHYRGIERGGMRNFQAAGPNPHLFLQRGKECSRTQVYRTGKLPLKKSEGGNTHVARGGGERKHPVAWPVRGGREKGGGKDTFLEVSKKRGTNAPM